MSLDGMTSVNLSGVPRAWRAVVPGDDADNCGPDCVGLFIQNAGNVAVRWRGNPGETVIMPMAAGAFLPGMAVRVLSTGTTATGIFAAQG